MNPNTTKLDALLAEQVQIEAERDDVQARLARVQAAVLEERFRDVEHYQEGDIVLVPRTLFGKRKMWPAQVQRVSLKYSEGTFGQGTRREEPWSTKTVSYVVVLQKPDGTFGGRNVAVYHHDVSDAQEVV